MHSFAGLVLRASKAMGAPLYLAKRLEVEPYDIYRWIAGLDLPEAMQQKEFERRLLGVLETNRMDPQQIERGGKYMRRSSDCLT